MSAENFSLTLRVLQKISAARGNFSAVVTADEFVCFKELKDSNYISGQIGPDSHDAPDTVVSSVRLTTDGRMLMEKLLAAFNASNGSSTGEQRPLVANATFVNYAARILADSYSGTHTPSSTQQQFVVLTRQFTPASTGVYTICRMGVCNSDCALSRVRERKRHSREWLILSKDRREDRSEIKGLPMLLANL